VNVHGKVYLVGAGPGDPDLLSVKALRLIQSAQVVVYDRLVSAEVMRCVPEGVARIHVGKATGHHTLTQEGINQLLVDLGRKGQQVVRLKGGDPFIFGRGSEEALALAAARIPFEIVPGVTAAQACTAYAGIPLTHRGLARGVQFITGHLRNNDALQVDKRTLADCEQTLVIYMGLANVEKIVADIIDAGRPGITPAAVVERGTTDKQRTLITSLDNLAQTVARHRVQPPALLVIGSVVTLSHALNWFESGLEKSELRYA
jgi:uroporphyrin-III C-methyltransferase/precorrin-2 dehydrogenase/sirohydrochlorin ferrochelatase/uroporphyrin-III C-methyltransferase